MFADFKVFTQLDSMDCGPTCLRMVANHYGKYYTTNTLRKKALKNIDGVSMLGISDAAKFIGFSTKGLQLSLNQLIENFQAPCILHWTKSHFVVLYKIKKTKKKNLFYIADPIGIKIKLSQEDFYKGWISESKKDSDKGNCLLLEPDKKFYDLKEETKDDYKTFIYYLGYLKPYKKYMAYVFFGMVIIAVLQLITPFLTQLIVDIGINGKNASFINLILIGQLLLVVGVVGIEYMRAWILLNVSKRISISMISRFLSKVLRFPISFFELKTVGDFLQRIRDHERIETFLSTSLLTSFFSIFTIVIYSIVLSIYDKTILSIYVLGTMLYFVWIFLFLKKRKEIDYNQFLETTKSQNSFVYILNGIRDIKLNNCERQKKWEWERIQAKLFKLSLRSLNLRQKQSTGVNLIINTTNIIITIVTAHYVISSSLSLGALLAIQFIIGQLNGVVGGFADLIYSFHDTKISLERLGDISKEYDEKNEYDELKQECKLNRRDIKIDELSFKYTNQRNYVLKNINIVIPANKVTAIVGMSGCGKTTLLKLLCGFYNGYEGNISLGDKNVKDVNIEEWRNHIGVVMQDGYLFPDTIENNIALSNYPNINHEKLHEVSETANIIELVESFPLGFKTKIGNDGLNLSQGQKQRILLARALYKNPGFLLLDEATNALDSKNESIITENISSLSSVKTILIVAHRLSTIKNADQIIVMKNGEVAEIGKHSDLVKNMNEYYELVKKQI